MVSYKESLDFTKGLLLTRLNQLDREAPLQDEEGEYAPRSLVTRMACFSALIVEPVTADLMICGADDKVTGFFDVGIGSGAQLIAQGWLQTQAARFSVESSLETIRHSYPLITTMMSLTSPNTDGVQAKYGLRSDYARMNPTPLVLPSEEGGALQFEPVDMLKARSVQCPFSSGMQEVYEQMLDTATKVSWLLPQEFATIETRL